MLDVNVSVKCFWTKLRLILSWWTLVCTQYLRRWWVEASVWWVCILSALLFAPCLKLNTCLFVQMGGDGLFTSMGSISYDNFGQKAKVNNFGVVNSTSFSIDLLMLFNQVTNTLISLNVKRLYYTHIIICNCSTRKCTTRSTGKGFPAKREPLMLPLFPCKCQLMPNWWDRCSWAPPRPGEWGSLSTRGTETCHMVVNTTHELQNLQ